MVSLFSVLWGVAASAWGANLQVPSTYPTVQEALDAAVSGDTIQIDGGDYSSEGQLEVDMVVAIESVDPANPAVIPPLKLIYGASLFATSVTLSCDPVFSAVTLNDSSLAAVDLDDITTVPCTTPASRIQAGAFTTVTVRNSLFSSLASTSGAAINAGLSEWVIVDVENTEFTGVTGGQTTTDCSNVPCAGAIDLGANGTLTIRDSRFFQSLGETGTVATWDSQSVTIERTTFEDCVAETGAALWSSGGGTVTLTDVTLINPVGASGAAITIDGQGTATVDITRLRSTDAVNTTGESAVLELMEVPSATVHGAELCGSIGGSGTDLRLINTTATIHGVASIFATGDSAVYQDEGTLTFTHNTIAGAGPWAIGMSIRGAANTTVIDSVLFVDGTGVLLSDSSSGTVNEDDNWAWPSASTLASATVGDPLLQGWEPTTTQCGDIGALWLQAGSPLRDAGDPTVSDLDGSPSDIGAYGGPHAMLGNADADPAWEDLDCDDNDPTIYPGAPEVPSDGIDQDCDGADLEDQDEDGFAATAAGGDDCDDTDPTVYPGATEIPWDGIDQDCDGYDLDDVDGDGFIGTLAGGDDCDDDDITIRPGVPEQWYDGVDQNCDGDDDYDQDGDGFAHDSYAAEDGAPGQDCDDLNPQINPDATEIWYDGDDGDCDGSDDYDQDGDGARHDQFGGQDCDDLDPDRAPLIPEVPYDGVDQDCTGADLIDVDGDGAFGLPVGGDDCNDYDATVSPDLPEDLTEVDRNCDGYTDPTGPIRPKGCDATGGSALPAWWLLSSLPFFVRRRRAPGETR
jgi:hypothetical protein